MSFETRVVATIVSVQNPLLVEFLRPGYIDCVCVVCPIPHYGVTTIAAKEGERMNVTVDVALSTLIRDFFRILVDPFDEHLACVVRTVRTNADLEIRFFLNHFRLSHGFAV